MKIKYFPQNIHAACMIQYQKKANDLIKKWAEDLNRPKKHTDCQQAKEKIFNIANYYRNAIQNYTGILLHTDYS